MARPPIAPRSQFPGPATEAESTHAAKANPEAATPSKRGAAEAVAALLGLFADAPGKAERAFLSALLSDVEGCKLGVKRNPGAVFGELVEALARFAPAIAAGKLPGFGPVRARFAAECARDVAPSLDLQAALASSVRVASKKAARAMKLTGPARRKAVCAVESLMANDPEARDRIRAAVASDGTAAGCLGTMERLAREVEHVRAHVPAGLLADAGLTADVLDALGATSGAAADARKRHRAERLAKRDLRGDLAAPTGRLVFELRQLLASARQARVDDPTIPAFTSKIVRNPKAAAKPAAKPKPAAQPATVVA